MMKAAQPGPPHKLLASLAGNWDFTSKFWTAPGRPPKEWKGTDERKMIPGGRFLQEEVTGAFRGMPFHVLGLNGYDKVQGKFVGLWADSMGTGMSQSVGTADATGKVITYEREEFDPVTKSRTKSRDVLRIISSDKGVIKFYKILPNGKEFMVMEFDRIRNGAKQAGCDDVPPGRPRGTAVYIPRWRATPPY
jgi:hypothetical protein